MTDELMSSPESSSVIVSLARLYLENKMFDQAIELCLSSLESSPESEELYLILYEAYMGKGETGKAREIVKKGLSHIPGSEKLKKLVEEKKEEVPAPPPPPPEEKVEEVPEKVAVEEVPPEKVEVEEGDPVLSVLKKFLSLKDIYGVLLVDESGLLISQASRKEFDYETTAALIASMYSEAKDALEKLELGGFESGIVELPRGKIFIFEEGGIILSVLAGKNVMLGLVLARARSILSQVKKILEG
ncbi:hypothetical protein DRQ20_00505 [bacterium]|nr:MAG: hypothetical protein DRQ20_00505 [bacterium]